MSRKRRSRASFWDEVLVVEAIVLTLFAIAGLEACAAHITFSGGMPGVSVPADYIPPRRVYGEPPCPTAWHAHAGDLCCRNGWCVGADAGPEQ